MLLGRPVRKRERQRLDCGLRCSDGRWTRVSGRFSATSDNAWVFEDDTIGGPTSPRTCRGCTA